LINPKRRRKRRRPLCHKAYLQRRKAKRKASAPPANASIEDDAEDVSNAIVTVASCFTPTPSAAKPIDSSDSEDDVCGHAITHSVFNDFLFAGHVE